MKNTTTDQTQEHHLILQILKLHPAITTSGFNIVDPINLLVCSKNMKIRKHLDTQRSVYCGQIVVLTPKIVVNAWEKTGCSPPWTQKWPYNCVITLTHKVYEIDYHERKRVRSGKRSLQNETKANSTKKNKEGISNAKIEEVSKITEAVTENIIEKISIAKSPTQWKLRVSSFIWY